MKNPWRRLLIITSMTGGIGVLMPSAAYAACNPAAAADVTVTCSGEETGNLDYTINDRLNLILDNTSTLTSSTPEVPAVAFRSLNGKITSQGTIETSGFFNDGIYITSTSGVLLDNQGTITAHSSQSNAIHAVELQNSLLSNRGTVITEGSLGNGILTGASSGVFVGNEGVISTSGPEAHGIVDENGTNNSFANSGTITTRGENSDAINLTNSSNATIINNAGGQILSEGGSGIALADGTTATITNQGVISSDIYGIYLGDNAAALQIQNSGIIVGGLGGIVADDNSSITQLTNRGIIGSIEGDAIAVSPTSTVVSGIDNQGIIIGRVNAPGVSMSNSGLFDLLNSNQPSQVRDYVQSSGGILALQADNTSNYGQLQASGTAVLNGNTIVMTRGSTSFANGDVLSDVVTASSIVGQPTSVVDDSTRYQFTQELTGTSYSLRIIDTGIDTTTAAVAQTGSTALTGIAASLDTLIANNNASAADGTTSSSLQCGTALTSALCAVTSSATAAQMTRTINQLSPLMFGSMAYIELNNLQAFGDIVGSRQDAIRTFGEYNEFNPEKYLWIRPVGRWDHQTQRDGVTGYQADTRGIAIGSDVPLHEQIRAGLAFGVSRTDVNDDSSDTRHDAQIESWNLLAYGSVDFTPDTALTWQTGLGRNKTTGNRYFAITNPATDEQTYNGVARSDYDSHTFQAGLGLQSTFYPADKWSLTPMLRTDYYRVKDKGYRENGADDASLNVDGNTLDALIVSTKAKVGLQLSEVVNVYAQAGVGYDTINDRSTTQAHFVGSPDTLFTYRGMEQSPWIGTAGVGVTAKFTDVLDGTVQYEAQQRSDFTSQSVSLKVRYAF